MHLDIERVREALTNRTNTGQNQLDDYSTWKQTRKFITAVLLISTLLATSFTLLSVEREKPLSVTRALPADYCCEQNEAVNKTSDIQDLPSNETRRLLSFINAALISTRNGTF